MKTSRRRLIVGALFLAGIASGSYWWTRQAEFHYLSGQSAAFVAQFSAPPPADSAAARHELDELLEIQRVRTPDEEAAARADRKKDVSRFYAALGLDPGHPPDFPALRRLTDNAEADIGPYVKAVKEKYRRLRPYEIEPKLKPCIGDVQGDLSYPSGHATYGYLMGRLLSALVPERQPELMKRADRFARQRMVCGVHFRSDLEAGQRAADYLFARMQESPDYQRDAGAARQELRAALQLR